MPPPDQMAAQLRGAPLSAMRKGRGLWRHAAISMCPLMHTAAGRDSPAAPRSGCFCRLHQELVAPSTAADLENPSTGRLKGSVVAARALKGNRLQRLLAYNDLLAGGGQLTAALPYIETRRASMSGPSCTWPACPQEKTYSEMNRWAHTSTAMLPARQPTDTAIVIPALS